MTQSHDQHHSETKYKLTLDDSQTQLNVDTKTLPQQEIGKSFASKKIHVASLAMQSSSFGSMSKLFPTKPGVAQQWYQPASPFTASSFSGTSHFGSLDNDRALLDKTWSVLAPKLESNQQHRTTNARRRRRVTFNDVIEFFEPPPPYDDETDDEGMYSLSTDGKDGNLTAANECQGLERHIDDITTTNKSASLSNNSHSVNNPILPSFTIQDDPLQHTDNSTSTNIPSSSTEPQISASSHSTTTSISSSWSSLSSSSSSLEYNSNKINALRSPLFNQKINASTCSLPTFQAPSSVVSLVPTPSSSSTTTTNTMIFRTKGSKVSKNTILDILEKRPHHHTPSVRRAPIKRLSSSHAPPGFHSTLDAVQNEIKQAIERAKASTNNVQQQQNDTTMDKQQQDTNSNQPPSSSSNDVQQQQDDRTMDKQKQNTKSNEPPSSSLSSSSNDTLSSTTTLAETIASDHGNQNVPGMIVDDDPMELSPTANNVMTILDTAPSDTSVDDFGETVLNALDKIMSDESIHSHQTNKTMNDQGNEGTQQDDWVKENNSQDQQPVHSPKIWHILERPEDVTLSTKASSLVDTNHLDSNTVKNGRLYLKVIAAANLDFPIDNDAPSIRCSIINGTDHLESGYYSMEHDIHFNHEFILDNVFPETELTVALQANQSPDINTKRWSKRTSWTDRRKSNGGGGGDLARYIHPQDRSLAQTRISLPSIAPQCRTTLCTASFALVNGWYRPAKSSSPRRMGVQEKAVGKIIIELFYLPNVHSQMANLPINMDACENVLNIKKFHQMDWRSGYMSQFGGDVKFWRRRYFKLVGCRLYSYTDTMHSPRTWIDLSQVVELVCDHRILATTITHNNSTQSPEMEATILVMALESLNTDSSSSSTSSSSSSSNNSNNDLSVTFDDSTASISTTATSLSTNNDDTRHDDLSCYSVKNGFHLKFSNGDKIDFFCDSTDERDQWLHVLKLILGRIPTLPVWLPC